jgi:hypothetical protein
MFRRCFHPVPGKLHATLCFVESYLLSTIIMFMSYFSLMYFVFYFMITLHKLQGKCEAAYNAYFKIVIADLISIV